MEEYLNNANQDLISLAGKNSAAYQKANPFPNIEFKQFFNPGFLEKILTEFPDLSRENSQQFRDQKQVKFSGIGEKFFGPETRNFLHFLNSEPFLNFLQILTGIQEPLIGDPYFVGGGQHEIKRGGFLKIHADFNKHQKLKLDRRINVLIYLNKNWKEEYGGHFELWDVNMKNCVKRISPTFNTMAIFSTTDFSYHGHPDPLNCPGNMSRKSLALYYYSNGRPKNEIILGQEEHSTLFKSRPGNKDTLAFKNIGAKMFFKEVTPPVLFKFLKKITKK